jgi:hypothetical protein
MCAMPQTHGVHALHICLIAAAFFSAVELSNIVAIWRSAEGARMQLYSRCLQLVGHCQPLHSCAACGHGRCLVLICTAGSMMDILLQQP